MIDVVRDDGAAAGDFIAHEFRRNHGRNSGAIGLTRVLAAEQLGQTITLRARVLQVGQILLTLHVFTDGDVFHLRRDDALARIVHLRDVGPGFGTAGFAMQARETQFIQCFVAGTLATKVRGQVVQYFRVAAFFNPLLAQRWQTGTNVNFRRRIGIGA